MDKKKLDKLASDADKIKRESRQPRLDDDYANTFMSSTWEWINQYEKKEVDYKKDSRERDMWLREFVMEEPHLASVLSTAISLDVNRGFTLVGGRNQVMKYGRRLNNVENEKGWRTLKTLSTRDFYNTDIGAITEIERDGELGPLTSLYHVDSARCRLTDSNDFPLLYYPPQHEPQPWEKSWFYRVSSMMNTDETFNQLGFCAISRCVKLAQIMIAVVNYDLEKLGHLSPRGLLFIESEGLTSEMWEEATKQREQNLRLNTGNNYYDNLMVLVDRQIKGELLALSGLPDGFDSFKFTEFMMRGYALAFNRDVRAFWSVNAGNFGGGNEAGIQYERATQGGIIDFATADQEQLQKLLPASLVFQYDKDDTRGKLLRAELSKKWTEVGVDLVNLGLTGEQVVTLLVNEGVIDADWTDFEEESTYYSEGNEVRSINMPEKTLKAKRERALENERVQRAVYQFRDEPIVEWAWPNNKIEVLWKKGSDAIKRGWTVSKMPWVKSSARQVRARGRKGVISGVDINTSALASITQLGLSRSIGQDDFELRFNATIAAMTYQAYLHHSRNRSSEQVDIYSRSVSILNGGYINKEDISDTERTLLDGHSKALLSTGTTKLISSGDALLELGSIISLIHQSLLPSNIYIGTYDDSPADRLDSSLQLWYSKVGYASELGKANETSGMYRWVLGDNNEKCKENDGVVKSASEWGVSVPKNRNLPSCTCSLEPI